MNRANNRVIERGRRTRFTLKSVQSVAIVGELLGQELQGHIAAQAGVLGPVDDTHAAFAEHPEDPIRTDPPPFDSCCAVGGPVAIVVDFVAQLRGCLSTAGEQRFDVGT
jgi:hypothetical protein